MKFKMKVQNADTKASWWEEVDTKKCRIFAEDETPEKDPTVAARRVVAFFNKTLRPGESRRRLLAAKRIR